jgi:hypothetical protein
MKLKTLALALFAAVAVVLTATLAAATSYGGDPYDGVNRMGAYYQYTNTYSYNYEGVYDYHYYDYIAPPRGGGWFGSGTEWITGLRSPVYPMLPPVHYTNYYNPTCDNTCWFGGQGYPRSRATDFGYRTRLGGVFSY